MIDQTTFPDLDVPFSVYSDWINKSFTAGQSIAWVRGLKVFVLNFLSANIEVVPIIPGEGPFSEDGMYDAYTNSMIWPVTGGVGSAPIRNQTTGNMLLSTFLRNLAERQGYETSNIIITGIDDEIVGAVIAEISDIETILSDLKRAYNFEILKRGPVIRFTRRNYGSDFEVDATVTEVDRALVSEDENEFVTVNSEIAPASRTPGTVRLKYIDPDYNYTANEFIHKRNADNVDLTAELQLNLPIIMPGSDAAALASRVLLEAAMNGVTHDFRLP